MRYSLQGHVAIVTGNSAGLGKAIGLALGSAGAKVPVNFANNEARARRTLDEYRSAGVDTVAIRADVTSEEGIHELFRQTEHSLGKVDVIVANATCAQPLKPFEEYDWDFYQLMLDFFIKSPFLLAKRGLPYMKERCWGRFINVTSEVFHRAVAPFSAYVAAKGGQIGWSRSMSRELAPFGITVNSVAPGWIPVERHENDPQSEKDAYRALIPANRWGTPQDVAEAVVYLASPEASFVTGQTICVNGGMTPW